MKKISGLVLFSLLFVNFAFAQGEGAFSYTFVQQDPVLQGAGSVGVAVNSYDVLGFNHNPAQLGNFGEKNNAALFFQPSEVEYEGNILSEMKINTFGGAVGYNFNSSDLPLSIGLGFIHSQLDYGYGKYLDVPGDVYDRYDMISVGAKYTYFLEFNLGFGIKNCKSVIPSSLYGEYKMSFTSLDFGFMATLPITKLWFNNLDYKINDENILKPKASITIGYALLNVGDSVSYSNLQHSDPIRRTANWGYSINLGLDFQYKNILMNLINYSFAAEVEDVLANRNAIGEIDYDGIFGNVRVVDNLINLKGTQEIIVHKGHIFDFFDTFTYSVGSLNGAGFGVRTNNAICFKSDGIFKFLSTAVENETFKYVFEHFYLNYSESTYFEGAFYESTFNGITIGFRGFVL